MADLTVNSDVLAGRSLAAYCWSCPCEASRAIADFLADMRSIAASGIFGAPLSLTVSAVCGRRNEWNGNVACEIAVKWSGADAN
jgi:hypothetical protein